MAGRFVLALDQGTTGSTALVVDAEGVVRARGYAEVPQHYPRPGWVEHDPGDLWTTVEAAATRALSAAGLRGDDVAAIGVTNQRETTIVWDRATSAPIHRAIVWQCRRTAAVCDRLRAAGHETTVRQRTGLVLDAYFSGTKIAWLLDHVPDARRRAARGQLAFGTVDTWLLWKLTRGRVHATDVSNASRTLCLNLASVDWDERMCALLRVPREVLPTIVDSSGPCGETSDLGRLPARPYSGCATASGSSPAPRRPTGSRAPCPTRAACTSCRHSSGSAPPTGISRRAAPSSASRAAPRALISHARRSKRSRSRAAMCWRRWPPMPSRRSGGSGWTAALSPTTSSASSRPM